MVCTEAGYRREAAGCGRYGDQTELVEEQLELLLAAMQDMKQN